MSESSIDLAWQLHQRGDHEGAERIYTNILKREPRSFAAWLRLGLLYGERCDYAKAERYMSIAADINPSSADAHFLRGSALMQLGRDADAAECLARATAIAPNMAKLWLNRAVALLATAQHQEALACIERSLALAPDDWDAHVTRGVVLKALGRITEAKQSFDIALAKNPDCIDALVNRATICAELRQYEEAAADCERVLRLNPDYDYMRGFLLFFRLACCDWRDYAEQRATIAAGLRAGRRVIQPLMNLSVSESAEDQRRCAEIWAGSECAIQEPPLWSGTPYSHKRIRIAYISEDFREHPVGRLMAPVLERHDKSRFEIVLVSLGPNDKSDERARVMKACDKFVDALGMEDKAIGAAIRDAEIDIAVDLMGYSGNGRRKIPGFRPAPVQASFLGYAGTMGAKHIDYLIADRIVIPESKQLHYAENIAYMPACYLPADAPSAKRDVARKEAGLPETGFVFCSFNNAYKITPDVFEIWMRLLKTVEGSVFWLGQVNATAQRNLSREATTHGIDSGRLIFAPHVKLHRDHVARLSAADLFLDTLPHNAHSTAIDALQAGLPILTCAGKSFAGRVGASILSAAGLDGLVVHSLKEYEALALALAHDPERLMRFRDALKRGKNAALFDASRFTRDLEALFVRMHKRANEGLTPVPISVSQE